MTGPARLAADAVGLGLRRTLLGPVRAAPAGSFDFLEAAPENWIGVGGALGDGFEELATRHPIVCHGLSLSLGGPGPLDETFLGKLRRFLDRLRSPIYSEHLSACSDMHGQLYDLMPLPFTDAAIAHVATRIRQVQDTLGRRIAVENISYYATLAPRGMPEIDFILDVLDRADCDLLLDINNLGLPAAAEFLDTQIPQFIADLTSWVAIGARTTESQVHRELASGLSAPIGFKNGTDGNIKIAIDAIKAASQPHHFLSVTKGGHSAIVSTIGNNDCHLILRGGKVPNYDAANVQAACETLVKSGLRPKLMVDASHANSHKDYRKQPQVLDDIAATAVLHSEYRGVRFTVAPPVTFSGPSTRSMPAPMMLFGIMAVLQRRNGRVRSGPGPACPGPALS